MPKSAMFKVQHDDRIVWQEMLHKVVEIDHSKISSKKSAESPSHSLDAVKARGKRPTQLFKEEPANEESGSTTTGYFLLFGLLIGLAAAIFAVYRWKAQRDAARRYKVSWRDLCVMWIVACTASKLLPSDYFLFLP